MTEDFQLYDVLTTCRECATQYTGKAFLPPSAEPRFGLCPPCKALDDEHMAKLKQPPKSHGKVKAVEPDPRTGTDRRRYPTRQTRWEPQD
jgi:hypothetical protein